VRERIYALPAEGALFNSSGALTTFPVLPDPSDEATIFYAERYRAAFSGRPFSGKKIVFYQHSSIGRDLLVDLLRELGAEVVPVGRSDVFVPIDTENVTPKDQAYFRQLAEEHPDAFAIVSTDGDSDRPFVIDESGVFNRGDVHGALVATWLDADFAAFPISSSDAVNDYLTHSGIDYIHTKIGSPYVVAAMQHGTSEGKSRIVGWEVNGGFLLGSDTKVGDALLTALPTRDAALPIFAVLLAAIQSNCSLSQLFDRLPARYTQAGLVDNFPIATSLHIMDQLASDDQDTYDTLEKYFTSALGFGEVRDINAIDGIRITFSNGDIAHLRSSRNAPQLRIYSVAASQQRADEIVELAITEPNGIIRSMERDLAKA
jgi:phosphomannomutase